MCWFFKKKQPRKVIASKYKRGDYVNFIYKEELCFGWIWGVYQRVVNEREVIVYSIQVGGQCPAVLNDIPETRVLGIKKD